MWVKEGGGGEGGTLKIYLLLYVQSLLWEGFLCSRGWCKTAVVQMKAQTCKGLWGYFFLFLSVLPLSRLLCFTPRGAKCKATAGGHVWSSLVSCTFLLSPLLFIWGVKQWACVFSQRTFYSAAPPPSLETKSHLNIRCSPPIELPQRKVLVLKAGGLLWYCLRGSSAEWKKWVLRGLISELHLLTTHCTWPLVCAQRRHVVATSISKFCSNILKISCEVDLKQEQF